MTGDDFIRWSGWIFGAILFAIKLYDVYRDGRPSLRIVPILTGDPEVGHTISFLNASKTPASIYYLEVGRTSRKPFYRLLRPFRQITHIAFRPHAPEAFSLTVPAYGQASMNFSEQDYFPLKTQLDRDLYLRIELVGYRWSQWFRLPQ
jgi:hypothetical protein